MSFWEVLGMEPISVDRVAECKRVLKGHQSALEALDNRIVLLEEALAEKEERIAEIEALLAL